MPNLYPHIAEGSLPAHASKDVWHFIKNNLQQQRNILLLWVLESDGSSPGRKGFKMAVSDDGTFTGTIGGGIMEHKMVEKARTVLIKKNPSIFLQRQFHDKAHHKDQSGMICSGSQLIAFVPLAEKDMPVVDSIIQSNNRNDVLHLSKNGLAVGGAPGQRTSTVNMEQDDDWQYTEKADTRPVIHIIGGGHVGLALSELMNYLGFYIKIYDNRQGLSTMKQNHFAHEQHIVDYENIADVIQEHEEEYVAIMTFGYRDDKTVFRQLLNKSFYYIGMMGSDSKIKTLFTELEQEGIPPDRWKHCHVPIGINIFSKTTREIAVSVAAEIIREKNRNLSTGRTA